MTSIVWRQTAITDNRSLSERTDVLLTTRFRVFASTTLITFLVKGKKIALQPKIERRFPRDRDITECSVRHRCSLLTVSFARIFSFLWDVSSVKKIVPKVLPVQVATNRPVSDADDHPGERGVSFLFKTRNVVACSRLNILLHVEFSNCRRGEIAESCYPTHMSTNLLTLFNISIR